MCSGLLLLSEIHTRIQMIHKVSNILKGLGLAFRGPSPVIRAVNIVAVVTPYDLELRFGISIHHSSSHSARSSRQSMKDANDMEYSPVAASTLIS